MSLELSLEITSVEPISVVAPLSSEVFDDTFDSGFFEVTSLLELRELLRVVLLSLSLSISASMLPGVVD